MVSVKEVENVALYKIKNFMEDVLEDAEVVKMRKIIKRYLKNYQDNELDGSKRPQYHNPVYDKEKFATKSEYKKYCQKVYKDFIRNQKNDKTLYSEGRIDWDECYELCKQENILSDKELKALHSNLRVFSESSFNVCLEMLECKYYTLLSSMPKNRDKQSLKLQDVQDKISKVKIARNIAIRQKECRKVILKESQNQLPVIIPYLESHVAKILMQHLLDAKSGEIALNELSEKIDENCFESIKNKYNKVVNFKVDPKLGISVNNQLTVENILQYFKNEVRVNLENNEDSIRAQKEDLIKEELAKRDLQKEELAKEEQILQEPLMEKSFIQFDKER